MQSSIMSPPKITTKIIKNNDIAYIKIPTFMSFGDFNMNDFFTSIQNYKYLIVDVRNNGGGSILTAKQLISKLITKPVSITNYLCAKNTPLINNNIAQQEFSFYDEFKILSDKEKNNLSILPSEVKNSNYNVYKVKYNLNPDPTHFNGKVFVLTNSGCFSATDMFCNTIKRIGAATLVGDYTGGDGILLSPSLLNLPYSNYNVLIYSWVIGIQDDGVINQISHTAPDYYITQTKESLINSLTKTDNPFYYDTVFKECLNIIDKDENK